MLYFCAWPEDGPCSLVLDASSKERAAELAAAYAEGPKPDRVVPIAVDVFVCEVLDAPDDDVNGAAMLLEPLEATDELLSVLEHGGEASSGICGATADDDGEEVSCSLLVDHAGDHQDESGGVVWGDDDA